MTSTASNSGRSSQHGLGDELPMHKTQCLQQLHIGSIEADVQAERD